MSDPQYTSDWWKLALGIAVPFIVFGLGLFAYLMQRRFELLKVRYLDEGLDRASSDFDTVNSLFWHNWQTVLVARTMIDTMGAEGLRMAKNVLDRGLRPLEPSYRSAAYFRLAHLLGDEIFWLLQQHLHLLAIKTQAALHSDFSERVNHLVEKNSVWTSDKVEAATAELVQDAKVRSDELTMEIANCSMIGYGIHRVAVELQQAIYSPFDVRGLVEEFKHREGVRHVIDQLRKHYAKEIEEYEGLGPDLETQFDSDEQEGWRVDETYRAGLESKEGATAPKPDRPKVD
jgi:hypothetical protein